MTERESEELYQNLRRKLEDYGSHPSEEVWASIQKQLPPMPPIPAARPMLRRRWRWMAASALLLGLVGLVLLTRLTPTRGKAELAQTNRPRQTPGERPAATSTVQRPAAENSGPGSRALPGKGKAASSVATAPLSQKPTSLTRPTTSAASTATPATTAKAKPARVARHATGNPVRANGSAMISARSGKNRGRVLGSVDSNSKTAALPKSEAALKTIPDATGAWNNSSNSQLRLSARNELPSAQHPAVVAPSGGASGVAGTTTKSGAGSRAGATLAVRPVNTPISLSTQPGTATNAQMLARQPATHNPGFAAAQRTAETVLASRPVSLARVPLELPAVQGVGVASAPGPIKPSRWAVEVLAGPALSYRRLSADSAYGAGLRRLERSAVSYAGQLQVSYALTPRWRLAAGLGYTEYATRYNYILRRRAVYDSLPPTQQSVQRRDTYRYLTLPLQARYEFGHGSRLRYGVLGGSTLGLYLGGRTSSGTSCACQQQSWSATSSPYRRISVGVTVGGYARYQLAPRWTLLAQPSFTYSLLSASKPQMGPARRPFAAGLLTGFSFDLP